MDATEKQFLDLSQAVYHLHRDQISIKNAIRMLSEAGVSFEFIEAI
jgi:hypothetical protein